MGLGFKFVGQCRTNIKMEISHGPDARPQQLPWWATAFVMAFAVVWLWPGMWLDLGLHGDEAFVGLEAYKLAQGGPIGMQGMNSHTGPAHQWLVAVVFGLFGPSVHALRSVSAVLNGVAVGLYACALAPKMGRPQALWAALLLLTLPAISTFGAVATEHNAFSFILAVAGWLLIHRAQKSYCPKRWAYFGGMMLGLGTWTHLVFVAMPCSLLILGVKHFGRRIIIHPVPRWALLGWLSVEARPFIGFCKRIKVREGGMGIIERTIKMPLVLFDTWQGDMAALRTIGQVSGPRRAIALILVTAALVGLVLVVAKRFVSRRLVLNLLLVLMALVVTTATIVPFLADRYILLVVCLLPALIVLGFFGLAECVAHPGAQRWLAHGLCTALLAYQCAFFVQKVVRPWHAGKAAGNLFFPYGVEETSNHYLDTRPVYTALLQHGSNDVVTQNFIGWALRFYDLEAQKLTVRLSDLENVFEPRASVVPTSTLVMYARGYKTFGATASETLRPLCELKDFVLLRAENVVSPP